MVKSVPRHQFIQELQNIPDDQRSLRPLFIINIIMVDLFKQ
jgi:hypothetical protein